MRRILVLRGGALGDLIVTLPALALLRHRWPSARIELAGNPTAAVLAQDEGWIDAIHSQHQARWSALFEPGPLPVPFAGWLAEFDLVLNYWPDADSTLKDHFPLRAGQSFLTANAHPTTGPAAVHYCAPLRALGLTTTENFVRLRAHGGATRALRTAGLALHPGSGSPRKNWPIDRWMSLAEWLRRERGIEPLIITGEADEPAATALAGFRQQARNLPLPSLRTLLSGCSFFIGHDSGVSHLAAACGVRCLLLFGPTDPAIWAPPAPHVTVLKGNDALASISIGDVQAALHPIIP